MLSVVLICPNESSFYNFRREFIIKLHESGYEVILVCPHGSKIEWFKERGCKFIDIDIDRRGTNVFKDLKLIAEYKKILKQTRPDIVLLYTTKCSVYAGMVCRWMKIPYVVNNAGLIATNSIILGAILNILYVLGFKEAFCMMYQNTQERDYVNHLLHGKVHYRDLPGSGVNLEEFTMKPYPSNDREVIFNYVARIVKIKGIEEYLECASRIKKDYPNTRFIIYGAYDDDCYKAIIDDLQKKGIIEYRGVQRDMRPYIEQAHAVIHPSYYEGMTNVVLEHSAMGRVCIGSNIPGVKEGIDDGKTGYLFEAKNVNSMVEAVQKFLSLTTQEKEMMGVAARNKMVNEFSRQKVTDIYLEEIEKALKR